jgi:hypothetical protein
MNLQQLKDDGRIFDPAWRLNNLYRIVTKDRKYVTLRQNRIQKILTENRHIKRKKILKARQEGVSTNEIISQLDFAIFHRNVTACILADCDDNIKKLFRIVQRAYKGLHPALRPELGRGGGSMYEYYFPDRNSRIYCALKSRGDTINWLHISESAFITQTDRIFATVETVPLGGIITHETTANGIGNHFYRFWNDDNGYKKFFFPWYFHDEYQLPVDGRFELTEQEQELKSYVSGRYGLSLTNEQFAFRRWKMQSNSLFHQEYAETEDHCFLSSGSPAMNSNHLRETQKPIDPVRVEKNFKIFAEPKPNGRYVCGADPSEGVDGDFSSATVLDVKTNKVVATIRAQLKPFDFAHELNRLCTLYNNCLLAVERNNHGHAVLLELKENIRYDNLYRHKDKRDGWLTDRITRPLMVDTFIESVESGTVALNDDDLIRECLMLINNNGKIEAAPGNHDDMVMACAIGLQMLKDQKALTIYDDIEKRILI